MSTPASYSTFTGKDGASYGKLDFTKYMEQFISEHGGVIVSGIVTIALLGIIMTVILAAGNMDAYEISKIIGG